MTNSVGRAPSGQAADPLFWAKVDQGGACWVWQGARDRYGYGVISRGDKTRRAHRHSFALAGGHLIAGFVIDHKCRNRACVNPAHLRQISNRQNLLESPGTYAGKAVAKTHCKRSHPLSGGNLRRNVSGSRRCKACDALWLREYRKERANG